MGTYLPIGINAAISNTSLRYMPALPHFSTGLHQEDTIYEVYPGKFRQALLRLEPFLRRPELNYGGGESALKQCDTLCRFLQVNRYGELWELKRWSRGGWSIPAFNSEDQEVSNEQVAAAPEEIGAEQTRILLGPNSASGEKRIFIFGYGYTSCALASYLKNNWQVSGTCRSDEKRAALEQCGYSAHVFNSDNDGEELRDEGLRELQEATHWLVSVPPVADFDMDPVLTTHAQDLIQVVGKGIVGWIGYLSSTSVYGDWQGDWVNEQSRPRPVEQKALARLAAEEAWLKFGLDHGVPVHVFRLGGIYGPGRSAIDTVLSNRVLSGRQRSREQRHFTSRIHVADICQTVLASMKNPDPGKTYNVVDDDPASRLEVLSYAQDLLNNQDNNSHNQFTKNGISSPKEAQGGSSSSNQRGEKRVSNKRIKVDLKVKLLYPTYREGLKAMLESKQ
ncbi:unnamed protein product [Calypogeia fissa]